MKQTLRQDQHQRQHHHDHQHQHISYWTGGRIIRHCVGEQILTKPKYKQNIKAPGNGLENILSSCNLCARDNEPDRILLKFVLYREVPTAHIMLHNNNL